MVWIEIRMGLRANDNLPSSGRSLGCIVNLVFGVAMAPREVTGFRLGELALERSRGDAFGSNSRKVVTKA